MKLALVIRDAAWNIYNLFQLTPILELLCVEGEVFGCW